MRVERRAAAGRVRAGHRPAARLLRLRRPPDRDLTGLIGRVAERDGAVSGFSEVSAVAIDDPMVSKLSPRIRMVLDALDDEFRIPSDIARRAGLPTRDRTEIAMGACATLEGQGLAERGGTRGFPRWRRKPQT